MSEISLRALRLAFLDHKSGSNWPATSPMASMPVVAVRWDGGFLDGLSISLSEDLNVLIGGPGSGKSTVIESLRYALEVDPTGSRAEEDHEELIRTSSEPARRSPSWSVTPARHWPLRDRAYRSPSCSRPQGWKWSAPGACSCRLASTTRDLQSAGGVWDRRRCATSHGPVEAIPTGGQRSLRALKGLVDDLTTNRGRLLRSMRKSAATTNGWAPCPEWKSPGSLPQSGRGDQPSDQNRLVSERQMLNEADENLEPIAQLIEDLEVALPPTQFPNRRRRTEGGGGPRPGPQSGPGNPWQRGTTSPRSGRKSDRGG